MPAASNGDSSHLAMVLEVTDFYGFIKETFHLLCMDLCGPHRLLELALDA